jgi:hypothetical protein
MTGFIDPLADSPKVPLADDTLIDQVRDLVLRAHPEVVPELVTGGTIPDLLASIEPAATAYRALAARFETTPPLPVQVPAGAAPPAVVDPGTLSPSEKVRRGLADRARKETRESRDSRSIVGK